MDTPHNPYKWKKARKKPIIIEYREPVADIEIINTREGSLLAYRGKNYIIRGVRGETYPIQIDIFNETYDVLTDNEEGESK